MFSWYIFRIFNRKKSILNLFFFNSGSYCPNKAGNPILCPPGYANDKHGRDVCDACPIGSYANVPGLAHCILCPAGFICSNSTMSPIQCPSNRARGQTTCVTK